MTLLSTETSIAVALIFAIATLLLSAGLFLLARLFQKNDDMGLGHGWTWHINHYTLYFAAIGSLIFSIILFITFLRDVL